ncbi:hypothetical protein PF004_g3965 [Phytophthora fragariae]|uniref:Secreted protein n=1 Tax=Phytophthora fragariae TaxID=53985 RepID=A0A6G0PJZ8_9STRA|nr:hypothetical protein PF004_g3965 [Phytophthora fragariae]
MYLKLLLCCVLTTHNDGKHVDHPGPSHRGILVAPRTSTVAVVFVDISRFPQERLIGMPSLAHCGLD